jgi:hypothetical protein
LKVQIDRIEAEIALQQSSADFISRAVPPSKPSYPKRKMIAGGAFVGITGLSVLFVVGLALTDRRIKSARWPIGGDFFINLLIPGRWMSILCICEAWPLSPALWGSTRTL